MLLKTDSDQTHFYTNITSNYEPVKSRFGVALRGIRRTVLVTVYN